MIEWGEQQRCADPAVFCKLACAQLRAPIWIIADARRPSDIEYFKVFYW